MVRTNSKDPPAQAHPVIEADDRAYLRPSGSMNAAIFMFESDTRSDDQWIPQTGPEQLAGELAGAPVRFPTLAANALNFFWIFAL
jgi:hypothetical protein